MRECFGKFPNSIGFPCVLCSDQEECSAPIIPEGSKIVFYVNNEKTLEAEATKDMKIYCGSMTLLDGAPVRTDSNKPVKRVSADEYRVDCCWQDAVYIKDGYVYESISDAD